MRRPLLVLFVLLFAALQKTTAQSCVTETSLVEFGAGISLNIDLATSPGDVQLKTTSVDQQNTSIGTTAVGVTATTYGGQTFTPAANGKLAKVSLNLFCSGCTGTKPNLNVQIRPTTGDLPTSTVLASATIAGFSSGTRTHYDAVFASPASLTAGTKYAIVVYPSVNPVPGTYALTRSGAAALGSDAYAGGTRISGSSGGTVWSTPLTGGVSTDAGFTTYMVNSTGNSTGTLTSQVKDAGAIVNGGTLSYTATTPTNTELKLQVAASNNSAGPFSFVGPDNTAATYYTSSGASLSNFTDQRYFQYKVFFSNTDELSTPTLSDVTLCFTAPTLPVRWLAVSGTLNSYLQAVIDWKVQETNVANYEVQKSNDGRDYSTVATFLGKGDGVQTYRFTEGNRLRTLGYFRIRQIDKNNKTTYSPVVRLESESTGRLKVWPNPAEGATTITVSSGYLNKKAELVDVSGKRILSFRINQLTTMLDLANLRPGFYLLQVEGKPSVKINKL